MANMAWQEGAVPPTISEDTVWGVCGRLTKTGVQERAGWTLALPRTLKEMVGRF